MIFEWVFIKFQSHIRGTQDDGDIESVDFKEWYICLL